MVHHLIKKEGVNVRKCVFLSVVLAMIMVAFAGLIPAQASMDSAFYVSEGDYKEIESALVSLLDAAGNEEVIVYDSSELTAEILEDRIGKTVVERCIGLVIDKDNGDGILLNTEDADYNYISYRGIYRPIENGSVIVSYMVYSSENNYIDDIVERYDFVLK